MAVLLAYHWPFAVDVDAGAVALPLQPHLFKGKAVAFAAFMSAVANAMQPHQHQQQQQQQWNLEKKKKQSN